MESLVIRRAEPEDVETVADFNIKMAEETEGRKLDRVTVLKGVKAAIDDPQKGFYLIAEKREVPTKLVGQLLVTFEWSDWRNKYFWWIQSVYVQREHRDQKVFSQLYRRIVKMAKQRKNVAGLRLYVEKHNELAKRVYEDLGMAKTFYEVYEIEF